MAFESLLSGPVGAPSRIASGYGCNLGLGRRQGADTELGSQPPANLLDRLVHLGHTAGNVSKAVQDALISILKIPSDDFFQFIHVLPRNRFLHTRSFLGMKYSHDFIVLELAFI